MALQRALPTSAALLPLRRREQHAICLLQELGLLLVELSASHAPTAPLQLLQVQVQQQQQQQQQQKQRTRGPAPRCPPVQVRARMRLP